MQVDSFWFSLSMDEHFVYVVIIISSSISIIITITVITILETGKICKIICVKRKANL